MSRDRQIAVLASIVGLAGLIIGIVALSQDSGADDEWVRNRALAVGSDGSSETPTLQTQLAVQGVEDLTNRVEEMERREAGAAEASTEAEEQSQATQVAVQGVEHDVVDLAERVAELETTSVPDGPEEVVPTEEIPTEEVEYGEEVDQVAVPEDGSGATEELTDELLTPPSTTEPEDEEADSASLEDEGNESNSQWEDGPWYVTGKGRPAYILHRELVVPIENTGIVQEGTEDNCTWIQMVFGTQGAGCKKKVLISDVEYFANETGHYLDKYLHVTLFCPNVINLLAPYLWGPEFDDAQNYYSSKPRVAVQKRELAPESLEYWLAPSKPIDGIWPQGLDVGSYAERKPLLNDGVGVAELAWEDVHDSVASSQITVIIKDNEIGELHYVDLTVSVSYYLIGDSSLVGELEAGIGPARCSADLTFVRSYP